jgi:hypothetical protein
MSHPEDKGFPHRLMIDSPRALLPCADRARLVQTVIAAITVVRYAKSAHEKAKRKQAENVVDLEVSLLEARAAQLACKQALLAHIEHHGCKL